MRAAVPRSKTPVHRDVDAESARLEQPGDVDEDRTEPELSPPIRTSPGAAVPSDEARSRKETLISPIPALMAAQMNEDDHADATPRLIDLRDDITSKVAAPVQEPLLPDDDSDYVVEFVNPTKSDGGS